MFSPMTPSIELISIGSELLSGRTLNSHAQTLGVALSAIGLRLTRDTTIPDEIETIQSAVREAFRRVDIVVVSGGLGPTSDDITREALAGVFERNIILSPEGLAALRERFKARGRTVQPVSERMALILEGAVPLINTAGAAVAQRLVPMSGKTIFITPGPPGEFAAVLNDHIVPWLCQQFPEATPLELRVLVTQGIGESDIVTILEKENFQCSDVSVGFYPGFGKVEIRLTAAQDHLAEIEVVEQTLRGLLVDHLL